MPFLWPFFTLLTALATFLSCLTSSFDFAFADFVRLGMGACLPWFVGLGNTDLGAGQWHRSARIVRLFARGRPGGRRASRAPAPSCRGRAASRSRPRGSESRR